MRMFALAAWIVLLATSSPQAQSAYPTRPVTLVVAFAAGGGTDAAARLIAKELAAELGQPVIVENRAGASGALGAASVLRAAPDGYTLLFGTGSELDVLPAIKTAPPYEAKDFEPISQVGAVSFLLAVHPLIKAGNVQELVDYARANPGQLTYASFGTGSTNHLIGEAFARRIDARLLHVPYKGSAAAATDLLSGRVLAAFDTVSVMLPYVQSGQLKALATLSSERSSLAPGLPTMAESGLADFTFEGWLGVLAPPNTPPAIVQRVQAGLAAVLKSPTIADALKARGVSVVASTPADFRDFMRHNSAKWKDVVQKSGIQVD